MSILKNIKTSQLACNSGPIDDIGAPWYFAAVGREFKFPLYLDIGAAPDLDDNKRLIISQYLWDVSNNLALYTPLLQVSIEEYQQEHKD